jgi:hypothetical protein
MGELLRDIVVGGLIGAIGFYMGYRSGWMKGFDAAEAVWIPAMERLGNSLKAEIKRLHEQIERQYE